GVSTHSLEEALIAEKEGADFITLGPVYDTPSKAKYGEAIGVAILKDVASKIGIPVFALGGITSERADEVLDAGAFGIALISSIFSSTDITDATKNFIDKTA
ncbi:MAG: thiamine phosphate synthase, partial [Deltaproteobacteria bacterium]|nr:thiamine phosphate synthase [Deltaproteobacteria bacterium]